MYMHTMYEEAGGGPSQQALARRPARFVYRQQMLQQRSWELSRSRESSCDTSSMESEVRSLRQEVAHTQDSLRAATRRCRELVRELDGLSAEHERERLLRDQQLSRILRALLVLESRLKQEQKSIRQLLCEKDNVIRNQQLEIAKLRRYTKSYLKGQRDQQACCDGIKEPGNDATDFQEHDSGLSNDIQKLKCEIITKLNEGLDAAHQQHASSNIRKTHSFAGSDISKASLTSSENTDASIITTTTDGSPSLLSTEGFCEGESTDVSPGSTLNKGSSSRCTPTIVTTDSENEVTLLILEDGQLANKPGIARSESKDDGMDCNYASDEDDEDEPIYENNKRNLQPLNDNDLAATSEDCSNNNVQEARRAEPRRVLGQLVQRPGRGPAERRDAAAQRLPAEQQPQLGARVRQPDPAARHGGRGEHPVGAAQVQAPRQDRALPARQALRHRVRRLRDGEAELGGAAAHGRPPDRDQARALAAAAAAAAAAGRQRQRARAVRGRVRGDQLRGRVRHEDRPRPGPGVRTGGGRGRLEGSADRHHRALRPGRGAAEQLQHSEVADEERQQALEPDLPAHGENRGEDLSADVRQGPVDSQESRLRGHRVPARDHLAAPESTSGVAPQAPVPQQHAHLEENTQSVLPDRRDLAEEAERRPDPDPQSDHIRPERQESADDADLGAQLKVRRHPEEEQQGRGQQFLEEPLQQRALVLHASQEHQRPVAVVAGAAQPSAEGHQHRAALRGVQDRGRQRAQQRAAEEADEPAAHGVRRRRVRHPAELRGVQFGRVRPGRRPGSARGRRLRDLRWPQQQRQHHDQPDVERHLGAGQEPGEQQHSAHEQRQRRQLRQLPGGDGSQQQVHPHAFAAAQQPQEHAQAQGREVQEQDQGDRGAREARHQPEQHPGLGFQHDAYEALDRTVCLTIGQTCPA